MSGGNVKIVSSLDCRRERYHISLSVPRLKFKSLEVNRAHKVFVGGDSDVTPLLSLHNLYSIRYVVYILSMVTLEKSYIENDIYEVILT